jgi:hypothetical protein
MSQIYHDRSSPCFRQQLIAALHNARGQRKFMRSARWWRVRVYVPPDPLIVWQSLETVGKQVLLRFQLAMTSQLQLILPALSRFEMAIRLGFSRATSGTFVITAGSLRM